MEPEERARKNIDRELEECGWQVQNRGELNISASRGVAVREFAMPGVGEADYLLYADGKAIGVVEAKPEDWTLRGVELQSGGYMSGLPESVPAFHSRCRSATRLPALSPSSPMPWSPTPAAAKSSPSTVPKTPCAWHG